jgi:hypothetical protein
VWAPPFRAEPFIGEKYWINRNFKISVKNEVGKEFLWAEAVLN